MLRICWIIEVRHKKFVVLFKKWQFSSVQENWTRCINELYRFIEYSLSVYSKYFSLGHDTRFDYLCVFPKPLILLNHMHLYKSFFCEQFDLHDNCNSIHTSHRYLYSYTDIQSCYHLAPDVHNYLFNSSFTFEWGRPLSPE